MIAGVLAGVPALAAPALATPGAPPAPTTVHAVAGDTEATVSWNPAPGSDVTYTVVALPGSAGCSTTTTSCTVPGLITGLSYRFTVVARTDAGTSPASLPSSIVRVGAGPVAAAAAVPPAPAVPQPPLPQPVLPQPAAGAAALALPQVALQPAGTVPAAAVPGPTEDAAATAGAVPAAPPQLPAADAVPVAAGLLTWGETDGGLLMAFAAVGLLALLTIAAAAARARSRLHADDAVLDPDEDAWLHDADPAGDWFTWADEATPAPATPPTRRSRTAPPSSRPAPTRRQPARATGTLPARTPSGSPRSRPRQATRTR
ncbi:fibronectin type III domain-containing protein [Goekera deserti]|uniref:Fibronectin type III domain-containing protein n=1 Tax=Goekera deserti TaxID=2497753 RepID=A0A7K3WF02_9ACTN|nr:fibronectin type III domain-containing protein [Goekera deserti]NDI48543.1 hypothetical protein [Goekera deserti]NEL55078.1 fibronectin type III domain-containing protein [Goekera deserti]